jgi:putative lipoprotein (rSAM/lipoprotein system)
MKKFEHKVLKIYNVLISGFLALLGFASSCDIGGVYAEYGTPSAKFIVNGKIESAATSQPIENIRVIMQGDTAVSDQYGKYQVIDRWGFPQDQSYSIEIEDIDGTINGEFENLDTIVEFKNPKFTKGDGDWYKGETSIDFNVKMNPK